MTVGNIFGIYKEEIKYTFFKYSRIEYKNFVSNNSIKNSLSKIYTDEMPFTPENQSTTKVLHFGFSSAVYSSECKK